MAGYLGSYRAGLAGLDKRARLITLGSALFVGARMSTITFLGVYFVGHVGLDAALVGAALFVEGLARGVTAPIVGALSDRVGRRPLLLFHIFATAVLLPAFLVVRDPWTLFAWSALVGAAQGPYFTLSGALLLDLVPAERRQSALSFNYTAISIGFTLGVAPAGWLAERGFEWLALSAFLGAAAVGVLYLFALRGPLPREERTGRTSFFADTSRALADRRFLSLAVFAIVFPIGIGLVTVPITIFGVDAGVSQFTIGLILSLNGLIVVVFALPVNARLETRGPFTVLPWAALFCGLTYVALAVGGSALWLLLSVIAFSVGEILFSSAVPTAVAALAPTGHRGAYQGAWGFLTATGIGAATLLAGLGRDHIGWRWTWEIAALVTFLAGLGLYLRGRAVRA